ncbi:MAG TPA: type IV pilus modification protein PilV [Gammaproteobacteria bacterium]
MITQTKGFTLIEALFAMFILAVGILGIIGLMLFAKQNNYDAIQRTTAAMLATDIVERMRVNTSALPNYRSKLEPVPANTVPSPDPCTPVASGTSGCTPSQIAARDLDIWHSLISGATETLPDDSNGGGLLEPSACITQVTDNHYRIAIAWRGRTALTNPLADTCGSGTVLYNGPGNANEFRRLFVMDAFIETTK